jgi:aryl-alcohol dehydrogenase-like predicted oxidoreductase
LVILALPLTNAGSLWPRLLIRQSLARKTSRVRAAAACSSHAAKGERRYRGLPRDDKFARSVEYQQCDFDVLDAVSTVATERGVTNSQVALAWVLQAPGVNAPIIGSTKLAHLDEAIAALDLKLTREEVAAIEKPYRPHSILGHEQPKPSRMSR